MRASQSLGIGRGDLLKARPNRSSWGFARDLPGWAEVAALWDCPPGDAALRADRGAHFLRLLSHSVPSEKWAAAEKKPPGAQVYAGLHLGLFTRLAKDEDRWPAWLFRLGRGLDAAQDGLDLLALHDVFWANSWYLPQLGTAPPEGLHAALSGPRVASSDPGSQVQLQIDSLRPRVGSSSAKSGQSLGAAAQVQEGPKSEHMSTALYVVVPSEAGVLARLNSQRGSGPATAPGFLKGPVRTEGESLLEVARVVHIGPTVGCASLRVSHAKGAPGDELCCPTTVVWHCTCTCTSEGFLARDWGTHGLSWCTACRAALQARSEAFPDTRDGVQLWLGPDSMPCNVLVLKEEKATPGDWGPHRALDCSTYRSTCPPHQTSHMLVQVAEDEALFARKLKALLCEPGRV